MGSNFDDLHHKERVGSTVAENHFYSLIRPPERTKPMSCLRCGRIHKTTKNKRICSQCKGVSGKAGGLKVGARAFYTYPDSMFQGGK